METEPICTCGHVLDDHESSWGPCAIEECKCVAFERDVEFERDFDNDFQADGKVDDTNR